MGTGKSTWTPAAAAARMTAALEREADPRRAAGAQRYFRETVRFFGVPMPRLRALVRELCDAVKTDWSLADALAFCERMLDHDRFEARLAGTLLLLKFHRHFSPELLPRLLQWLENDRLDSWAAVDAFCPDALGPLLLAHPQLAVELRRWTASPNRWVQRAALVAWIKPARRGRGLDEAYGNALRLFSSRDDLVQKAAGWLLREAGKTDMERLARFLLRHGPSIPRTSLRYAIERFPAERRRQLLAATRRRPVGGGR